MPVIVLTGRGEEQERVRVLDLGADDYVVKPCSLHELEARIRAVLRRGQVTAATGRIELGRLVVDRTMHRVELDGDLLDLTPKEFDLLAFLAASPDQVYSREELLEHVWGSTQDWQDPATVTEHVRRLRLKLEADPASPRWLQTVRGVGYRLSHDDGTQPVGKDSRVHAGAIADARRHRLAVRGPGRRRRAEPELRLIARLSQVDSQQMRHHA